MRVTLYAIFFQVFCFTAMAQTTSEIGVWLDHLPYGEIKDMAADDRVIYCAAEQGLFIYDQNESTIDRVSKVNGLSDVSLTAITWSDRYQTLIIGYLNGNIDFYENGNIINFQDIKLSTNYAGRKQVNYITVDGKYAYICTDFGIVQYDLEGDFVEETFIIGENGTQLGVQQLAFSSDSVFAATEEGLYAANRNAPLLTFESWNKISALSGSIPFVCSIDDRVFAYEEANDEIMYNDGQGWQPATQIQDIFKGTLRDMRSDKGLLLMTNAFGSQAFSKDLSNIEQNFQAANQEFYIPDLNCAVISDAYGHYWVGTNGVGMIAWIRYQGNLSYAEKILPNSPSRKGVIQMYHDDERLFVAPGGLTNVWGPAFNDDGYYELEEYDWINHLSEEYNGYKDIVAFVSDVEDRDHYYASSYGNGILEFRNGTFERLINSENSDIPAINSDGELRIGGFATDPEGGIWFTNSSTDQALGVIRQEGEIEMYSMGALAGTGDEIKNIIYTSQDQIWIQLRNNGLVVTQVVDGVPGDRKKLTSTEGSGGLPNASVLCFAEDLDGEIWLGTIEGMGVLYSPQNIFEEERDYDFDILVDDADGDGNGERVLGTEIINDIEVDGSNKKWFATGSSGVFYTSENGKEQIYNFNVDNSPLPSNTVLDIEIDDITGMVYFATDQGIVSFQGSATRGVEDHVDVFAYPNPVEPGYDGPVLIRGLVTNAQVKIADIEGNIVYETIAEGGQAIWAVKDHAGQRVKSGVYLAFITNDDGSATAVTKIMVIN